MTAPEEGPATGERTRAHTEALAEMYRAVRDALLSRDRGMSPGCWTVLHWQATYESPTADPRIKVSALVHLLGELVALVDAWCEQVDVAVIPVTVTSTDGPTAGPTDRLTVTPTITPTDGPTAGPTNRLTAGPTNRLTAGPTARPPGGPPEPESPAAVAQCITDVAGWFDRSARALLVGAVEMKYLAAELEGTGAVGRDELVGARSTIPLP